MLKNIKLKLNAEGKLLSAANLLSAILIAFVVSNIVFSADTRAKSKYTWPNFCSKTAELKNISCHFEGREDYFSNLAKCINESNRMERIDCYSDSRDELIKSREICEDEFTSRLDFCTEIGEQRYDPDFSPENFVDPRQIGTSIIANPYFPLIPGNRRVYKAGDETVEVTFTNKIKLIAGVKCLVVRDVVTEDGDLIEDTLDWFAQDKEGNVWYCGEEVKDYEINDGDEPNEPELDSD